ncbi:flagellin [Asticcacaulis sp. W401b]|uniref:flagellin n=1 Tax=Asticcacaulis sp. W401b TaxID=3388666 RepID=UPI003971089B
MWKNDSPQRLKMTSIRTNQSAITALQSLGRATSQLNQTHARLSSGLTVSGAKDEPAIYSIAQNLKANSESWTSAQRSLVRGQSILDVASAGVADAEDALQKMQEQAVSLTDPSLSSGSRNAIQGEIQRLVTAFDAAINGASFDGINLLNRPGSWTGDMVSSFQQSGPTLSIHLPVEITTVGGWMPFGVSLVSAQHVADGTGAITNIAIEPMHPSPYGDQHNDWDLPSALPPGTVSFTYNPATGYFGMAISGNSARPVDIVSDPSGGTTRLGTWDLRSGAIGLSALDFNDPASVVQAVKTARDIVTEAGQAIGSKQNGLERANIAAVKTQDALNAGIGTLVDADLGKESAILQAQQIKQQLATQALSIASQQPQWILNLFNR